MDRGKIMNDLNSVMNQLQGADCGCFSSGQCPQMGARQNMQMGQGFNRPMAQGHPGAGTNAQGYVCPGMETMRMVPGHGRPMAQGHPGAGTNFQEYVCQGNENMLMGPGHGRPMAQGFPGAGTNVPGYFYTGNENMMMGHGHSQPMAQGHPGGGTNVPGYFYQGNENMMVGNNQPMAQGHPGAGENVQRQFFTGKENMLMGYGNNRPMAYGMMQGDMRMGDDPGAGNNFQRNVCPGMEMAKKCMGENYTCCRHGIHGGAGRCCRYGDLGGMKFSSPGATQKQPQQQLKPSDQQPPSGAVDASNTQGSNQISNQNAQGNEPNAPNSAAAASLNQVAGGDNAAGLDSEAAPIAQEPIYPSDTKQVRFSSPEPRQNYELNALGQPVQMMPPGRYHSPPNRSSQQMLSPNGVPMNQYRSIVDPMKQHYVKSSMSKTSIPRRSTTVIPKERNVYRGSLSSTGHTVKAAAQGGSSSDGRLQVSPPQDQTPRPKEQMVKVAGDATSGLQDEAPPQAKLKNMPEGTAVNESPPPRVTKGKLNGLQDRNFTNSTNLSWSFGRPLMGYNANPYPRQQYNSPTRRI